MLGRATCSKHYHFAEHAWLHSMQHFSGMAQRVSPSCHRISNHIMRRVTKMLALYCLLTITCHSCSSFQFQGEASRSSRKSFRRMFLGVAAVVVHNSCRPADAVSAYWKEDGTSEKERWIAEASERRNITVNSQNAMGSYVPAGTERVYWTEDGTPDKEKWLADESQKRNIAVNSQNAINNYVSLLADICRCLESLARLTQGVQVGGIQAAKLKKLTKTLLDSEGTGLSENIAAADTLIGLSDTNPALREPQLLAIEALESIAELRDGVLEGARQQRVLDRLKLAQNSIMSFLRGVPRKALLDAEAIVEEDYKGAGVFPWRNEVNTVSSTFRPGSSKLLRDMEFR